MASHDVLLQELTNIQRAKDDMLAMYGPLNHESSLDILGWSDLYAEECLIYQELLDLA